MGGVVQRVVRRRRLGVSAATRGRSDCRMTREVTAGDQEITSGCTHGAAHPTPPANGSYERWRSGRRLRSSKESRTS